MAAETLFSKARLLAKAGLHELLDKGIDELSIPVLKQKIRDLEAAVDDYGDALAISEGHQQRLVNAKEMLQKRLDQMNDDIDLFLSDNDPSNDHLAESLDMELVGLEQQLEDMDTELADAIETSQTLDKVFDKLNKALVHNVRQVREVEIKERSAVAKGKAAEALDKIGGLANMDASVDSINERIDKKAAVADARLKRALAGFGSDLQDDVLAEKSRKRIAARRAKLNK
ncbi:MAG: PspA/IM30 family protein [Candidatus Moraniibacteriota bacterium]|jgi:exonuclease VII small subunit/regulator of replication initiation timing